MQQKLHDFIKRANLKPSQLAEMLSINPAAVSHLLAGRNKPSFDLLQKILQRFPQINPDWLLLDRGPMYRPEMEENETAAAVSTAPTSQVVTDSDASQPEQPAGELPFQMPEVSATTAANLQAHGKRIARIIICFEDQTFVSYTPER